jgi:hypothetical protein
MYIVQPRNYSPLGPIRSWIVTADKLKPFWEKLRAAAIESRGNHPQTYVGPWCRDCLAKHACPALAGAADAAMDLAAQAVPMELPADALGVMLRMRERSLALLEASVTGLREQASAIIKGNGHVPGYEIERGTAREQWKVPPEEVFALGTLMGVDLRQQRAITPAQARKLVDASLVDGYAMRPPGALKLQQVNNTLTRKVFGNT